MRLTRTRGDCWPNPEQELLLRAALFPGPEGIVAWQKWKSNVDIGEIDPGSYQLLPLLYRTLRNQGIEDPLMGRLKGVYRRTWYENQFLFHRVVPLLRTFHLKGIQTMLLKGSALVVTHYRDYSLRPMDDFDLLVPVQQAAEAVDLMTREGFALVNPALRFVHSSDFIDGCHRKVDLHKHVLSEPGRQNLDADFWDGAIPIAIGGLTCLAPSPADQLVHVCVHGVQRSDAPACRWIADAITLIRDDGIRVDWNRLLNLARRHHLTLPMRDTLTYLRDTLHSPIPPGVLDGLRRTPVSQGERATYGVRIRHHDVLGPMWAISAFYLEYCARLPDGVGPFRRVIGFPRFLQRAWRADHLWYVPLLALAKGMRWIGRLAGWHIAWLVSYCAPPILKRSPRGSTK